MVTAEEVNFEPYCKNKRNVDRLNEYYSCQYYK